MTAILLLSLFVAVQAPAEPPASSKRPNLQVLTTVPESQLFPMMNAIADSLGVQCDHCHVRAPQDPTKPFTVVGGWTWDRDDKPSKRVARDMMRMVLDVNARQFGGRMVVTCYTCHQGTLAPVRFPPLPPREYSASSSSEPRPLPSVDDVWRSYVRAVGEPAGGFSTTVLSARDDRSEERHGTLEVAFKGQDRVRITSLVPPDGPLSQVLNGDRGWVARDGVSRALSPDDVVRARRAMLRYSPIKIDRPANWRILGIERVRDHDAYVATADVDERTKKLWFFDRATGLLLRERTTTDTSLVPLQEQIDYDDYRRVDGVMLPFFMRTSDGAPYATSTRVFTSITHNVNVDDVLFERPGRLP